MENVGNLKAILQSCVFDAGRASTDDSEVPSMQPISSKISQSRKQTDTVDSWVCPHTFNLDYKCSFLFHLFQRD